MKKGLLIAFHFPPLSTIATHRLYSFARYFNEDENFKLDVLCPDWDEGSLELSTKNFEIIKIAKQNYDVNYGHLKSTIFSNIKNLVLNKWFKLNYFRSFGPHKFYLDAIQHLEKMDLSSYDFLITSYGPLDSIHIGNYIKKRYPSIKWVIDYRDLYSLMEYYDFGIFKGIFIRKEKKLTKNCDAYITVSDTLERLQRQILPNKPSAVIFNGYELDFKVDNIDFHLRDTIKSDLPIISYTGSFYNGERDIQPFLNFFFSQKLNQKFRLVFAILNDEDLNYLNTSLHKYDASDVVIMKNMDYKYSQSLQRKSFALLLFANFGSRGNGFLTGKFFEYIGNNKPIIYSGNTDKGYELFDIIRANNLGDSFERFNFDHPESYNSNPLLQYTRKNQAKKFMNFIDVILND